MKFTKSKDGVMRTTVRVEYRISNAASEWIAFVTDRMNGIDNPKFRLATHKEIVTAIRSHGFDYNMDYGEEYDAEYWELKKKRSTDDN